MQSNISITTSYLNSKGGREEGKVLCSESNKNERKIAEIQISFSRRKKKKRPNQIGSNKSL